MNARIFAAAFAVAAMSLMWFLTQRHNTSVGARVREMETGVPAWDAGAAKDAQEVIAYAVKKGHAHYASLLQGARGSASPRPPGQTAARE